MGELPHFDVGGSKEEAKFCRYLFNRIDMTAAGKRLDPRNASEVEAEESGLKAPPIITGSW